jgi:xanthine/uracil/vitamin C permease (AzgA family)
MWFEKQRRRKYMLEKLFKLKENNTTVKTEVVAGITTFMTMAYILAVNPSILADAGMDANAVLIATCLASFIGTVCMAFMANMPFALSAGMGLNAYLAYSVVGGLGVSWQVALFAVFVEGIIFIVLSLTNVREAIFNAIPLTLKKGVSVGIGLFIAFIGLQNAKLIVNSDSTLVTYQVFKGETFNSVGVGAILALTGANIPLGIGMMAAGGVALASAVAPVGCCFVQAAVHSVQSVDYCFVGCSAAYASYLDLAEVARPVACRVWFAQTCLLTLSAVLWVR